MAIIIVDDDDDDDGDQSEPARLCTELRRPLGKYILRLRLFSSAARAFPPDAGTG